jgi:tetratricopeptide (TPR) repeat protein
MLSHFNITGVLMNSVQQPIPKKILMFMYKNKDWTPVYFDFDAMIFLKNIPQNKKIIDRYKIDLAKWPAKELDLLKLGFANVTPYQNINRAYTLESIRLYEPALAEARFALKVAPDYREPYKLIGSIYGKMKDYRRAFEYFRIAAMLSPRDKKIRHNLALAYYDLGEYKYAIEHYQKIINAWPKDPKGYFWLAKAYVKDKQYDQAVNSLKSGFKLDPQAIEDTLKVGDALFKEKQYDAAQAVYSEAALKGKGKKDWAYYKIGLVYLKTGDTQKAQEAFKKGLEANPKNEQIKKKLKEAPAANQK